MDNELSGSQIEKYQYDLCVIGAGSAGLNAAFQASKYCLVALCDFNMLCPIKENNDGIGTSSRMNLELLPKMLLHKAIFRSTDKIISNVNLQSNWKRLVFKIKKQVNELAKSNLMKVNANQSIRYFNEKAEFLNDHTIKLTKTSGLTHTITANKIIIATGTEIINQNVAFGITSDDIFQIEKPPEKILIVGEILSCLEYAGILSQIGIQCTMSTGGIHNMTPPDGEILEKLTNLIEKLDVKIVAKVEILALKKCVKQHSDLKHQILALVYISNANYYRDRFDIIVYANSRTGRTSMLNLSGIGLKINKENNKILARNNGRTTVPNIFVVGSVSNDHKIENSTGFQTATQLIRRLQGLPYSDINESTSPRIVMTPIEYGYLGYTEEKARHIFGEYGCRVYTRHFTKLHQSCLQNCFMKIICTEEPENKVVGVHILAHHVSDVLQTIATSMSKEVKREEINVTVNNWPSIWTKLYFE